MTAGPPQPPQYQQAAPRCYRHPDRETWVSCTRCERPICPDCLRPAAVGFQCPQCVAEGQATTRQPKTMYGGRVVARTGLVTAVIAALNIVAYIATAVTSTAGVNHNTQSKLFNQLTLDPVLVAVDHEYWRLIGSAFMHIGLLHLVLNMVALGVVGPSLERYLGYWRYLALYVLSALGGSLFVYLFDIRGAAGASGAIFGLFAAVVVVSRNLGLDLRPMLVTIGINFAFSFTPGISLYGHLGGFVTGGLTAFALVYAPKGANRTPIQILAMGGILAVIIALVIFRTGQLTATYGTGLGF
jgi:membrane associated rhomboid family serine protease